MESNKTKNLKTLKIFAYISISLFILVFIIANSDDHSTKENLVQEKQFSITNENRELIKGATRELYLELLSFKDDKKFHEVGFGTCCKYNEWLQVVDKVKEKWSSINSSVSVAERMKDENINLSTSISYIRIIGMRYAKHNGTNDKFCNEQIPKIKEILDIK